MTDEQPQAKEPLEIYGTVQLIDWIPTPAGQQRGIRGQIRIESDEDSVGFRARGANSANWMAHVEGETEKWHIFGCQIRAIIEHGDVADFPDTYTVR